MCSLKSIINQHLHFITKSIERPSAELLNANIKYNTNELRTWLENRIFSKRMLYIDFVRQVPKEHFKEKEKERKSAVETPFQGIWNKRTTAKD